MCFLCFLSSWEFFVRLFTRNPKDDPHTDEGYHHRGAPCRDEGERYTCEWYGICNTADINKGLNGEHNHNAYTG